MKHRPVDHYLLYNKLGRQICEKSLRKRVYTHLATFVEVLTMIIEIVPMRPIENPRMLDRVLLREGILKASAQIVIFLIQVYVLVYGVTNQDI